ncbi:MAG TPA: hypothetical protein VJR94_02320 [Candidatus Nitrosocosmicus sp.]|nr:hypothetical protein [Candidatus Nitrosocosmicus sp.]
MMPRSKTDKLTVSLIIIVISIFFFTQNFSSQSALAQSGQGSGGGILSCTFVQYCSNPVETTRNLSGSSLITPSEQPMETTQAVPEDETQAVPGTPELIPDVTSNISLIMTPDLPGNLGTDELQNSIDPTLQSSNQTVQTAIDDSTDGNLSIIPENATVITPSSEIPSSMLEDNVTIAIENEGENNTENVLGNMNTPSNNMTLENFPSPAGQNLSQVNSFNETIDSTAANETIISPQESEQQRDNVSSVSMPSPTPTSQSQPSPTAFLDPIINPFKELFGLK